MRLAFDIDGVVISEYSQIFSTLISALMKSPDIEIFIISARENSNKSRRETISELTDLGIIYDHLILTNDKQNFIQSNSIDLFIDNQIENFIGLNNDVCCLLVREKMNYCWESDRFLGSKKTMRII